MRETEFAEVNQNLEKPVIIIKNLREKSRVNAKKN